MDLDRFYRECSSGENKFTEDVFAYMKTFENVILRGAAAQGKAVGKKLLEEGVPICCYWDQRAEELRQVNGIKVEQPFSREFDREKTLIVYCIPNHVILPDILRVLKEHGYHNIVRGDIFYSGLICQYKKGDVLSTKKCWQTGECRSVICDKAHRIIKENNNENKEGERIDLTYCCFIINSICNLSCKHCVQFINNYPKDRRSNVPLDVLCKDIDVFLDMVDSVGTISVMGGETFMHPDVGKIAQKFSEKKNFGFASFPTNGLYPIKPEQLEGFDDPRMVIAFGYYKHVANEKQLEIYDRNIELVKSYGITYTESIHLPSWLIPSGLYNNHVTEEAMTIRKQGCKMPPRNLQVREGKVHPCDKGVAVYQIGVADYPEDYLELHNAGSRAELRQNFREYVDRPFYYTCGHCGPYNRNTPSAIQGIRDVFTPGKEYDD